MQYPSRAGRNTGLDFHKIEPLFVPCKMLDLGFPYCAFDSYTSESYEICGFVTNCMDIFNV